MNHPKNFLKLVAMGALAASCISHATAAPIAEGNPKYLGSASPGTQPTFTTYWNHVTPENAGKWGSVQPTAPGVFNWGGLDNAYNLAKSNGYGFRMHTLIWGRQQPAWIQNMPAALQLQAIRDWFAAVAARYPDIDHIDVVNEPLHAPPDLSHPNNAGRTDCGNYIAALGGAGETGWDWIITAFQMAREYFPNAKLVMNDYSITNTNSSTTTYLEIIALLQERGLIDAIGEQGHAFSTRGDMAVHEANLDRLAATGLPIQITELDIDGPTDEVQLQDYMRIFPVFWEHPGVEGITLWGYREGQHWRNAQGAYVLRADGSERPALTWLRQYVESTTQAGNAAPVVDTPVVSPEPSVKGQTAIAGAGFTDPDGDDGPFTVLVNYGDGSGEQAGEVDGDFGVGPDHVYNEVGTYSVTVSVTDQHGATGTNSVSHSVVYDFDGFHEPVKNPPVVNVVKAGQAVPVKFSLGGDQGLEIFAAGYPASQQVPCDFGLPLFELQETVTAGSSSLSYEAGSGRYIYVWKTEKSWKDTCRILVVKFKDGREARANFSFK